MPKASAGSVTIDRSYFDTLLRKANFLEDNDDPTSTMGVALPLPGAQNLAIVNRADYDGLISIARQYANLRTALMNGGVSQDAVDVLSQGNPVPAYTAQPINYSPYKQENDDEDGARLNAPNRSWNTNPQLHQSSKNGHGTGNGGWYGGYGEKPSHNQHEWAVEDGADDDFSASYSAGAATPDVQNNATFNQFITQNGNGNLDRPFYARVCKRTVVLAGLPEGTTHWDVTQVIRGGLILEVYLRAAEHSALVSFLQEEDAVRFYEHVRRNDLYINHKRVFIKWADRHFHLAGHVAGKIGTGATRNMIIRRCDPNHTEDNIRDDLEHIHNLVVVKIEFLGGSCYIKTNSVHNAMFARTCMMSRVKYKGSKIEWDLDECEQPLEVVRKPVPHPQRTLSTKKPVGVQNRFASLRLDDDDDLESDDKFDTSSEFPAASTVNVRA